MRPGDAWHSTYTLSIPREIAAMVVFYIAHPFYTNAVALEIKNPAEHAAVIAAAWCSSDASTLGPSCCVWLVPGTEEE